MDEKGIRKGLRIFSALFIVSSLIELVNIVILWNSIINFGGNKILFQDLILTSSILPMFGKFLFFFIVISAGFFLIIGILQWKMSSNIDIEDTLKAKQVLFLGVLILMFSFIKIGYITFLGRTKLSTKNPKTFQYYLIINSPLHVKFIWYYFISVACFYLASGLVVAGAGLKWTIIIREKEIEKENNT